MTEPGLRIRAYRIEDEQGVVNLWGQTFPDPAARNAPMRIIHDKLKTQRELFFVALLPAPLTGEKLVGTILAGWDGHRGWFYHVAVLPELHRQGIGRKLIEHAERKLRELGCSKINLQVMPGNQQVVRFYEKAGYHIEDRISLGKVLEIEDDLGHFAKPVVRECCVQVNENVQLTEFRPGDEAELVTFLNDAEIARNTVRIPFPYTHEDARHWFELLEEETTRQGQPLNLAIRQHSGELIGGIGLVDCDLSQTHKSEFGYWLAAPFRKRGVMTEVVGAFSRHAFTHWKLQKLSAHIFLENQSSQRVLQKNDFLYEGLHRHHYQKEGQPIDVKMYAKLASE